MRGIGHVVRHRLGLAAHPGMTVIDYHGSRLVEDDRRDVVWQSLWRYRFSAMVRPDDCLLDLGAGYCNFINCVVARRRIAIDSREGFPAYLAPGIEHKVGSATNLDFLDDGAVDCAFASNLFEHLTKDEFSTTLDALRGKLSDYANHHAAELPLRLPRILRRFRSQERLHACKSAGLPHRQWLCSVPG